MLKVLLTGFEPFANDSKNPSLEVSQRFSEKIIKISQNLQAKIITQELPCVFFKSANILFEAIEKYKPDLIICLGLAAGSREIAIERVAINLIDAVIPDNQEQQPVDINIYHDENNAYFSKLPVKVIFSNLQKLQIPVKLSFSAGSYVCNFIMYVMLNYLDRHKLNTLAGFIHIPYIKEYLDTNKQDKFSLQLEVVEKAIEEIIITSLSVKDDLKLRLGKIY